MTKRYLLHSAPYGWRITVRKIRRILVLLCLFNYFTEPEPHTAVTEQLLHAGHIMYHVCIHIPTAVQLLCFKTASYHQSNTTTYSQNTLHVSDYIIHHLAKYIFKLQVKCNYWYYTIISLYFFCGMTKKKLNTNRYSLRSWPLLLRASTVRVPLCGLLCHWIINATKLGKTVLHVKRNPIINCREEEKCNW